MKLEIRFKCNVKHLLLNPIGIDCLDDVTQLIKILLKYQSQRLFIRILSQKM